MSMLLGAVVWADGQLAPAQQGCGPLQSPEGWRAAGISGQLGAQGEGGLQLGPGDCLPLAVVLRGCHLS